MSPLGSVRTCGSAPRTSVVSPHPRHILFRQALGMTTEVAQTVQWWIGDALNFGEQRYGEMYTQAIDETGLGYDAIRQMKWVASQYEMCTRVHNLSWTHHRAAASDC